MIYHETEFGTLNPCPICKGKVWLTTYCEGIPETDQYNFAYNVCVVCHNCKLRSNGYGLKHGHSYEQRLSTEKAMTDMWNSGDLWVFLPMIGNVYLPKYLESHGNPAN